MINGNLSHQYQCGRKLDPEVNKKFEEYCNEFLLIKDKELDESRGILEGILKDLRDKKIAPGEAEQKFAELENLQDQPEVKKFKKAIKDYAEKQKNEKVQEKLKIYQDFIESLVDKGAGKVSKELVPSFVNGEPKNEMDLNEASIRFQMFAGLDPIGPKEIVSKIKFEELKNRFAEKDVNQEEKVIEHFTNLTYSKNLINKENLSDVKKAMLRALKKVETLLP
ncbi:hypothetical protein M9B40_02365 [SAR86 cluster bacterium]|uniref:Uncharacterized protein n=1 Tax=SAR86 cluster bacterium TaxID=2030880 RepID=A0A9Q8TYZ9_9GAMM|nr:hypothetical protein M9B40_02365 [SAR86 cluster bacterium]